MKKEIRVLGIDDAPFDKWHDHETPVIGVVFRGGSFIDGILSTMVKVDGDDATTKLVTMICKSKKFHAQLQAILLDGIAVAGFNVIDVQTLHKETRLPVIVVMRKFPNIEKIKETLHKLHKDAKIPLIEHAGPIERVGKIYIQRCGIDLTTVAQMLQITTTHADIPEPLRVAHLIGSGLVFGESRGKA
ncbi:DUF99 family protein [Candidatus Woesearchaeota archaeon]|nr:DUF99 family protein [Candidatus Woesearchaeota archaeon]